MADTTHGLYPATIDSYVATLEAHVVVDTFLATPVAIRDRI